eukprot:gene10290-2707_t
MKQVKRYSKLFQPLRGTHDILPIEQKKHDKITNTGYKITSKYNFKKITTPILENEGIFKTTLGEESDVISKEMYSFKKSKEDICLRPENTAGIVRSLISNSLIYKLPQKYSYDGPMFRYERPQKGRYRQFHQFGVEHFGSNNPLSDFQIIQMAVDFLKELKILNFKLEINTLGDLDDRNIYKKNLLTFLKKHEFDLSKSSQEKLNHQHVLRILDSKSSFDQEIISNAPKISNFISEKNWNHFEKVLKYLRNFDIQYELNPYLVRGLDYYTHTTFEFKVEDSNLGTSKNTILAGGRYNELVKILGGNSIPAIGWASGIERLKLLIEDEDDTTLLISFIFVSFEDENLVFQGLKIINILRENGIRVTYSEEGSLKKQLEKSNDQQSTFCFIFGEDEFSKQQIKIKNMSSGNEEFLKIENLRNFIKDLNN